MGAAQLDGVDVVRVFADNLGRNAVGNLHLRVTGAGLYRQGAVFPLRKRNKLTATHLAGNLHHHKAVLSAFPKVQRLQRTTVPDIGCRTVRTVQMSQRYIVVSQLT